MSPEREPLHVELIAGYPAISDGDTRTMESPSIYDAVFDEGPRNVVASCQIPGSSSVSPELLAELRGTGAEQANFMRQVLGLIAARADV